ncbi:MAG: S8 family serine peptidase, partial [Gammaproteobacteria bacterium]
MTRPVLRLLGGLLIALLGVVHTVAAETLAPAEMYADANASRLLLVTFRDRGIERMAAGPRLNQYMTRRAYAATTWSRRRSAALADDYHLRELAAWPVSEIGQHCVVFLVPADVSVADVSTRLAADPRVEIVQPMTQYATMGSATSGDPYFALQSALQEIPIEAIHARTTGAGVHVAIIDTGADDTHPDLAGQFQLARDFTQGAPAVAGDLHGTAVAGIIAAKRGNGLGIVGLAPDARLQVYKACWQRAAQDMLATCNTFTLALALNTALREHAQVINLSLSGPEDAILTALIRTALARGVVIVAALSDAGGGFP